MFVEDMSVFFNKDEHAVLAKRLLPGGATEDVAVLFDRPDALFAGDMVQAPDPEILYPAGQFAGLEHGEQLLIESETWKVVSEPSHIEDGRMMKAQLKPVYA